MTARLSRTWQSETLAPFRSRIFFAIWTASLASYFGTLIQLVGASWLMKGLELDFQLRELYAKRGLGQQGHAALRLRFQHATSACQYRSNPPEPGDDLAFVGQQITCVGPAFAGLADEVRRRRASVPGPAPRGGVRATRMSLAR